MNTLRGLLNFIPRFIFKSQVVLVLLLHQFHAKASVLVTFSRILNDVQDHCIVFVLLKLNMEAIYNSTFGNVIKYVIVQSMKILIFY